MKKGRLKRGLKFQTTCCQWMDSMPVMFPFVSNET